MANEALKRKLITAGKVLAAAGQGDFTRGHISARLPGVRLTAMPIRWRDRSSVVICRSNSRLISSASI